MMSDCEACNIGKRLELFVDDQLVDQILGKADLRLHQPEIKDDAFITDKPWEGTFCGYVTVINDGDGYRMYYQTGDTDIEDLLDTIGVPSIHTAVAVSSDGIHWERPDIGIYEFNGNKHNNIVWEGVGENLIGCHGFTPFKDTNPDCAPDALYKATGSVMSGDVALYGLKSADGFKWSLCKDEPIMSGEDYDSQNVVFWDDLKGEYRTYVRKFSEGQFTGCRGIKIAASRDFMQWPERDWLVYPGSPEEQLYTNQVRPYYRAPHIYLGFPSRYVERPWSPTIEALPQLEHRKRRAVVCERYGAAVSDGLFMASRDGKTFKRWDEAFIRPGLRSERSWTYGDCYQAGGILETRSSIPGAPNELSFYAVENYWRKPSAAFRRYTLRVDGFVSVHAPLGGGELFTKPIEFEGEQLHLNVSTSAGGSMKVEILNPDRSPIDGYTLDDCYDIVGDTLEYTVRWKNGCSVQALANRPVVLHVVLQDADLYSYRFV